MYLSLQIKALLLALKDFDPDSGDSAYTMGIVDVLHECVELSNRPGNLLNNFFQWILHIFIQNARGAINLISINSYHGFMAGWMYFSI